MAEALIPPALTGQPGSESRLKLISKAGGSINVIVVDPVHPFASIAVIV